MKRRKKYRGISLGTLLMLVLTLAVCGGCSYVLPKLMGHTDIAFNAGMVFEVLNLGESVTQLALSDIPLGVQTGLEPTPEAMATLPPASNPQTHQPQQPAVTAAPAPTVAVTAAPTAVPVRGGTFTMTFGGTVNMGDALRKSGYYSESEKYDFSEMLSFMADEMRSDLTLVSLENLVIPDGKVSALIAPADVMNTLQEIGVDVLALGFPEGYEKKLEGLASTIDAANATGMTVIGGYKSQADRDNLRIVTLDNVKVALLHYTQTMSSASKSVLKKETSDFALPLTMQGGEPQEILSDIEKARTLGAQVIVVSLNWGTDGKGTPSSDQKELAQQLADAGADVIVGTGTLVVQPAAWLTGKNPDGSDKQTLCVYSLGSLLNELRKDGNVASILLQLTISCDGNGKVTFDRTAYTPTYIWRYKQDSKYYYRVVASDKEPPDGMSDDQASNKDRAFENVKKKLADSPLTLR